MKTKKGNLVIISGPSGTGKGTIAKKLAAKDDYILSVSRTTREPREGEEDGIHYIFTKKEEFLKLIEEGGFLEYAEYDGNFYGTPVKNAEDAIKDGKNVILEIEMQGALKIKENYSGDFIMIFVIPPSKDELTNRLMKRGESSETIGRRLKIADEEAEKINEYDYLIINANDSVERAVSDVEAIIYAESLKVKRNVENIENFKKS